MNRYFWLCGIIGVLCGFLSISANAGFVPDPNRIEQIAAWLPEKPQGIGRPISDRKAWELLAKDPEWRAVVGDAEKLLGIPMPLLTDELYLKYSQIGDRDLYQAEFFKLRDRVRDLVMAEGIENKGRFISAIEECIEQMCGLKSWGYPAHDGALEDFQGTREIVDLGAAHWAWILACTDYVLQDKLSPKLRTKLQKNMQQRIFDPIRKQVEGELYMEWWFTTTMNWNSVCLSNVTGAALAMIEDRWERAFFVAVAEHYVTYFLDGFAEDGYCTEGVGYWNYGYGSFLLLVETLLQATDGKLNLMDMEKAKRPARYGYEIRIIEDISPAFSDCVVNCRPSVLLLTWLSRQLREPLVKEEANLKARGKESPADKDKMIYDFLLFAFGSSVSDIPPQTDRYKRLPERNWFEKGGVLVVRPGNQEKCRLAAAMKGGDNAEHHNHNDVGTYIVVEDELIALADVGSEVYTKRTFGDRRYESKALNSYGHPVPVIAGKLQRTGPEAQGKVLQTEFTDTQDTLVMDIASAYDVPTLEKLERTFIYNREKGGCLTIEDVVKFSEPNSFETAMMTFETIQKIDGTTLRIGEDGKGVRVKIESSSPFEIRVEPLKENLRYKRTATRIGISLTEEVETAKVVLEITPL